MAVLLGAPHGSRGMAVLDLINNGCDIEGVISIGDPWDSNPPKPLEESG